MARARFLRLLLSLALATLAVVLGGVSVVRKVGTFQPLGFTATAPAGGIFQVERLQAPRTGLQVGDQILAPESGSWTRLAERLRESPTTRLNVLRGERVAAVTYQRPPLHPDWPYLVLALVGVAYLGIGLYTLLRHGGGQGLLFYLWCFLSATLYLATATPPVDLGYMLIDGADTAALILLPALTLHLFLAFPVPLPLPGRSTLRRLVPFVYLPAAVLLALELDLRLANGRFLFGPPSRSSVELLGRIEIGHFVVLVLAAAALLVWRLRRERDWEQHRQMQWVAVGLAGGYAPFLLFYGVPFALRMNPAAWLTTLAVVPLALVPLAFAYAILRYKLWDIEVVVRDTISSTLTLLLGIIGFALVNLAISRGISEELALARNLLTFLSGLGIAAMLVPARGSISSALERVQYGGSFSKRRALAAIGPELLHDRSLSGLCDGLLRRLEEGLELPLTGLYLAVGGRGERLVAVRGPGGAGGMPPSLPHAALGEGFWTTDVLRLSGLNLPTEPLAAATRLFAAGFRYAFPLAVRGEGIGIVLCGFRRDQVPLSGEDLELIGSLLEPASLALENAQLLTQLQTQLDEVQRLQEYSAGIFESSPAGIAVLDADHRLRSANSAFGHMVGREASELVGCELASVLPVQPLPAPGEGPIEVSYCEPSGSERYLQLSLAPFAGAEAAPHWSRSQLWVLVVHDVSERVAMENQLREKDRLAALGVLAAGVAHEVNTPITGISSYAQMLLSETDEDDPRYELLKKVERQTFRASRIVNNLLEYAREHQREPKPVDLVPLIGESLDLTSERFAKRRIELAWEPPARSLPVLGCDGELQQVFTNLIVNALDAMHEKGGRLTVTCERYEERRAQPGYPEGGSRVAVRFADTGPGVPAEKLETIFQPFFSTKLNRGGTGLGLGISHDIVKRHGGTLRVESRPGAGACFVVDLPLHALAPGPAEEAAPA
jgi:signal transduction histidine kinase